MSIKVTVPNNSSDSLIFGSANTTNASQVTGIDSGSSNGQLAFYTTASSVSTERMRIDSSGNVGIGTSSPNKGSVTRALTIDTPLAGNYNAFELANGGTLNFSVATNNTATYLGTKTSIPLVFNTADTERMRLDTSGNLLLGCTTSRTGNSSLSFEAGNSGIFFRQTGTGAFTQVLFTRATDTTPSTAGFISTTGTTTSYVTTSDYRLKENVAPMTGALAKVSALKPVTYTWKTDSSEGQGFIAHELQEVVPDCVTGEKDAVDAEGNPVYQGIDTSFLVATLTAAIQELKAELDTVKTELATLKGQA